MSTRHCHWAEWMQRLDRYAAWCIVCGFRICIGFGFGFGFRFGFDFGFGFVFVMVSFSLCLQSLL
jgi:hypothetical protein